MMFPFSYNCLFFLELTVSLCSLACFLCAHILVFFHVCHSLHQVPTILFPKCSNALIQNQFDFSPWRPPFRNPPASCLNWSDWSLDQLHTQLSSGNFPWPGPVVWSRPSISVSIAGVGLASCLVPCLTVDPSQWREGTRICHPQLCLFGRWIILS